ncbi:hypothetical protein GBA52_008346 [Prunus armeniaca]|nr:hypothetical protein GBA52_008346 [Prunus armeniaca]
MNSVRWDQKTATIYFFFSFFLVNTMRCPYTQRVGFISARGSACPWPQSASNGFRTPVIEAPGSSQAGDGSLPTAPHLVVI